VDTPNLFTQNISETSTHSQSRHLFALQEDPEWPNVQSLFILELAQHAPATFYPRPLSFVIRLVVPGQILHRPLLILTGKNSPGVPHIATEKVVVLDQDGVEGGPTLTLVYLLVVVKILVERVEHVEQHVASVLPEPDFVRLYDFRQVVYELAAHVLPSHAMAVCDRE